MANGGEDSPGIFEMAREIGASLVTSLGLRLELFGIELQQEKRRVFGTVFLAMSASLAGFMALLFANLTLVVSFWERRAQIMLLLAAGHLLLAIVCGWFVRLRLAGRRLPFPATTAELRKDAKALRLER